MKTTRIIQQLFCLPLLAMPWSCTSDSESDFLANEYPLMLSAEVKGMDAPILRSVADIGHTGVFVTGGTSYTNVKYMGTDGTLTATTQGYWGSTGDISIYAYAPYQSAAPTSIAVKTDQSTNADYTASDFLYAAPETFTFADRNNISLTFGHHFSKINLTLKAGDGVSASELTTAVVQITGTKTKADIDFTDGTLSALSDIAPLTPHADGANECKAIVVPQTVTAGTALFEATIGARSFGYTLPEAQIFEQGKQYNYTLTLSQGSITVSPVEITTWTEDVKENAGVTDKIYRIGDYYPDHNDTSTAKGVVFWLDPASNGRHGKVVSLDEGNGRWGDNAINEEYNGVTGIRDVNNGKAATRNLIDKHKGETNFATTYYAFNWIYQTKNKGNIDGNWYLPAKEELQALYAGYSGKRYEDISDWEDYAAMPGYDDVTCAAARTAFNAKLTAGGGVGFQNSYYWSSSETDNGHAWLVYFSDGDTATNGKFNYVRVRAVSAF